MFALLVVFVLGEGIMIVKKEWKIMRNGIFISWGLLMALAMVIGIMAFADINEVITGFHHMFLSDSKWVLNPARDRSVRMFSVKMYKDVFWALGGILLAVFAGTLMVAMWITGKKLKNKEQKHG